MYIGAAFVTCVFCTKFGLHASLNDRVILICPVGKRESAAVIRLKGAESEAQTKWFYPN